LSLARKAFPNCKKLDKWEILSGGAFNTTYRLQIGPDSFVLRLYVRGRSHCKTEKAIHQLIYNNVLTPKLIYSNELYEPWAYSIFEFVSGSHISELPSNHKTSLCYQLGSTLGFIHAFKFEKAGLFSEGITISKPFAKGSSPYFEETLSLLSKGKNVRDRLGDRLRDKTLAFIQKNKDFFPKIEDNICLTHSDFKPLNLLSNDAGKIFVLDWEFAHAGIGIFDFSILLRHRDQFPFDLDALREGYATSGGKLPDEWFRSALITDFLNIVTLLDTPSERPKLFHQLKSVIKTTMDSWD